MSEELNQVQDTLFDDFSEADVNEFTETPETSETAEDTEVETAAVPQAFLKVKYNGEERDLNEEDARTLAQKGMNYDRIYEPLERLAKKNNMSVGEYLNQLNDTQVQYEVSMEVDRLKEDPKYEGVSDEILEEIAHNRIMENVGLQEKSEREAVDAQQMRAQREVDMFLEEYPEFRNRDPQEVLDPKVFDYVKQGYTLLEAYNKFQRSNPQMKAEKLNEANRKKSLGNITNAGKAEVDDFLSGFLD